jgi:hypothetical protein
MDPGDVQAAAGLPSSGQIAGYGAISCLVPEKRFFSFAALQHVHYIANNPEACCF